MASRDGCIPLMDVESGAMPYPGLDRSPTDDLLLESIAVDGEGNLFSTFLTNTAMVTDRATGIARAPRRRIAKGCKPEDAIEKRGTILMSKPERFRKFGESLIWDLHEGVMQDEDHAVIRRGDPVDLAEQAVIDDGRFAIGQDKFWRGTDTLDDVVISRTETITYTHGENCLIWCSAIAPSNSTEEAEWRKSLQDSYGHVSYIYDPCLFARAMAMMAFRSGIRGHDMVFTHKLTETTTSHTNLSVVHGPVEYVEDTSNYVLDHLSDAGKLIQSAFVKSSRYRDQREYRFVILATHEIEDLTLSLDVSSMMRSATKKNRHGGRIAPRTKALNTRRALLGNPLMNGWDERDIERFRRGEPALRVTCKFTATGKEKESITARRTTLRTVTEMTEEDVDLAIAEVATTPQDARLAKVVWNTAEGESKCLFNPSGLPATNRYEIDSARITIEAAPGNPGATVEIDPSDACPEMPGHQVDLLPGRRTNITFKTTAEDDTTTATCTLVAVRPPLT